MVKILEVLEAAGGPVPDGDLSARAHLVGDPWFDAFSQAEAAGFISWCPAGWFLLPAGRAHLAALSIGV